MELLQGIETRRSIRGFKSTPVPRDTIERILTAASKSASYTNSQPWEVAVVTGEKKEELAKSLYEKAKSGVKPNSDLPTPESWPAGMDRRTKEHNANRLTALGIGRDDELRRRELRLLNFEFYGAPCVLFLFIERGLTSWSVFDMGLFAGNIILAAHSLGLGACLQGSIAGYPDIVRDSLGIPQNKVLLLGISLGYPDLDAPINAYHSRKMGLDEFVRWYI